MQPTQNTAALAKAVTRRWDGEPETAADRRFFDLRESGYTGPIDQDGYSVPQPNTADDATVVVAARQVPRTLRDAAVYLAKYGWIQGCYYDPTATVFTPGACVVGAIGMVCYGGPADAPAQHFDDPGFEDFSAAYATLLWHLIVTHGPDCDPYKFNDARGRTVSEVIDALTGAADMWCRIYCAQGENTDRHIAGDALAHLDTSTASCLCGGAA